VVCFFGADWSLDVSAPDAGAAPAAGGPAPGPRPAAAGRYAGRGELREEEEPATGAGGTQGEAHGERHAEGMRLFLLNKLCMTSDPLSNCPHWWCESQLLISTILHNTTLSHQCMNYN